VSDLGLLELVGHGALGGFELSLHLLPYDRHRQMARSASVALAGSVRRHDMSTTLAATCCYWT
jgi:hypothetical protein